MQIQPANQHNWLLLALFFTRSFKFAIFHCALKLWNNFKASNSIFFKSASEIQNEENFISSHEETEKFLLVTVKWRKVSCNIKEEIFRSGKRLMKYTNLISLEGGGGIVNDLLLFKYLSTFFFKSKYWFYSRERTLKAIKWSNL